MGSRKGREMSGRSSSSRGRKSQAGKTAGCGQNGVKTNGAAAKVIIVDRLWKKVLTPWHFWEDKSRLTGVPKKSLCHKHTNCSDPISADPIRPSPSWGRGRAPTRNGSPRRRSVTKFHPAGPGGGAGARELGKCSIPLCYITLYSSILSCYVRLYYIIVHYS